MRGIIVGVDPGTTSAYAILDSYGQLIHMDSSKFLDLNKMISEVIKHGNPMIVGCDKNPAPWFVEKLATKVGAKLVFPDKDLLHIEKKHLVNVKTKNDHEADAYASARYAFNQYKHFFRRIDKSLRKKNKQHLADELKQLLIKEEMSISLGIEHLEESKKIVKKEVNHMVKVQVVRPEKELEVLRKEITLLEEKNRKLRKKFKDTRKDNKKLRNKIKGAPVNYIIEQKENNVKKIAQRLEKEERNTNNLKNELKKLKEFFANSSDKILVKKLKNLSQKEFDNKKWLNIKEKDALLVDNVNIASKNVLELIEDKVIVIIYRGKLVVKHPAFIFVNEDNFKIEEISDLALINKNEFDKIITGKQILKKVLVEYKKKRLN